jgi:hypothetical protein
MTSARGMGVPACAPIRTGLASLTESFTQFLINADHRQSSSSGALAAALRALARGLCTVGADAPDFGEAGRSGQEWRILRAWAQAEGREVSASIVPDQSGGREHDLAFIDTTQRWRKFTKWDRAGYTVELVDGSPVFLSATPEQYLRRLELQNTLFGDDLTLTGIQAEGYHLRLVTEQPHIVGHAPEWADLDALLAEQHGFIRLNIPPMGYYLAHSYLREDVGIFDVHPANCVMSEDGLLVPIDFIVVRFDAASVQALQARL